MSRSKTSGAGRLAEVEVAFTTARIDFNESYKTLIAHYKANKSGPHLAPVAGRVNIEFPAEGAAAKALAVETTKKREVFHRLMAERAQLLQKLGRIR